METVRIDGSVIRTLLQGSVYGLRAHIEEINELNVFPVPDGDTGTNMSMTINAAARDLRALEEPTLEQASSAAASAMLRGARGNSGVILSLLLRGMSKRLRGCECCDGVLWAKALQEGVDAAYKAVMKPAEGTILTVARLAAGKAMETARKARSFETVHSAALEEARVALANTTNQNPVLKKAGVVDAGGKGWVVLLEAMLMAAQGKEIVAPEAAPETAEQANFADFNTEDITFTYCTEFIISRENKKDPEKLRSFLSSLGDSLVLVDDDEIIKVHVHTNDPGKALHEAMDYGSFVTVKIENMRLQHSDKVLEATAPEKEPEIAEPEKPLGVVSVCAGEGLAEVFRNLGVDGIISGGQTMNPSTEDILKVVNTVPAETVFVLPNNKNIIMAAQQVDALTPKKVVVISSKTVPQGITAMLSFNPEGTAEENEAALTEALSTVDTMQITYAARDSDFDGHDIHEGDYLAIFGSALFGTDKDIAVLLKGLAEKVRESGKEYITIYYGADMDEAQAQQAADIFASVCPDADINLLSGGQPVYYYLISAE